MTISSLTKNDVEHMLQLQSKAVFNGDPFTPSSRELYERAFQFQNFALGVYDEQEDLLVGYCNCSIPTNRATKNLGKYCLPASELNNVGHINTILIDADYRRHGHGAALLSQALSTFKHKEDIHYILTTLHIINTPSYNLFCKFGFQKIKTIYDNTVEKNLLLLKI